MQRSYGVKKRINYLIANHILEVKLLSDILEGHLVIRLHNPAQLNHHGVLGPARGRCGQSQHLE